MNRYEKRIDGLRAVEVLCYSVCLHLLIEEQRANLAAKAALIDLYADERFWELEGRDRECRVRQLAVSRSIQAMQNR
ncbi:hypothetical protein [Cohnella luojiensis]|uniref:Uncharacterized protein n=1 Tax=Cohnella luojiensis TaxID=652876 RepID=A0A4Y8M451_9BACL|nr:hypothetical protein [Cohnella luojiensis]TFE29915.1 hypothetical protein E2980_03900 [Cohnella luojiensis]